MDRIKVASDNLMDRTIELLPKYPTGCLLNRKWIMHRFNEPNESDFHKVYLEANLALLRGALLTGFLFGLAVLALDYWLAASGLISWQALTGTIVALPLVLAMLIASFHRTAYKFLTRLGIAVGLSIAAIMLLTTSFVEGQTMGSTFTGYVLVTFYIYLFLGQHFWPAFITAIALFVSFLAAIEIHGNTTDMLVFGSFLIVTNLICSVSLYCHENYHRKSFLEKQMLKDLASRDPLTGLPNRRTLDEYLDNIWSYAKRESQPIALALIDIDHFKAYNDTYGHQAGDRNLVAVAQTLEKAVHRPLDFTARYGGEEFVALLVGSTAQDAERIINDLRLQIQALDIPNKTSSTANTVTVSAGVAHLYPHNTSHSIEGFIQLADEALYKAKNNGRNRVILSGDLEDKSMKTGFFRIKPFRVA